MEGDLIFSQAEDLTGKKHTGEFVALLYGVGVHLKMWYFQNNSVLKKKIAETIATLGLQRQRWV